MTFQVRTILQPKIQFALQIWELYISFLSALLMRIVNICGPRTDHWCTALVASLQQEKDMFLYDGQVLVWQLAPGVSYQSLSEHGSSLGCGTNGSIWLRAEFDRQ